MLYESICLVNQRLVMGENVGEEEKQQVIDAILALSLTAITVP